MRATVIQQVGGPEVLQVVERELSAPGPGEALVKVEAAGVNFIDTYHRSGLYPQPLPFFPGLEGAGMVLETGPEVNQVVAGDKVMWCTTPGAYAEQSIVPADQLIPVPDGLPVTTAAAVALQGLTTHYLVRDTFQLGPGHTCLIHAGAGGVGLLLTQVAKQLGATVFTTVGSDFKAELSQAAGADHVIVYTREDFVRRVEEIGGERCLDVIYDGVGKATLVAGLGLLRPRGVMVALGNASGAPDPINPLELGKASLYLTRPSLFHHTPTRAALLSRAQELFSWIEQGLEVRIGAQYPLSEAPQAHLALESRATTGKVLLLP